MSPTPIRYVTAGSVTSPKATETGVNRTSATSAVEISAAIFNAFYWKIRR